MQSSHASERGNESKPSLILLLGNVAHEGITSPLKSGGTQYKKKILVSSLENWTDILGYFLGYAVRAVIAKMTYPVYGLLLSPNYSSIADDLFANIAKTRHAIFVHEEMLSGDENPRSVDGEDHGYGWDGQRQFDEDNRAKYAKVNEMMLERGLTLIPYQSNAEITVIASRILQDALDGLLFRIYVPAGRLWANEVDRLRDLFRDYLARTGRRGIRLNQIKTEHGISYEFHGDEFSSSESIAGEFHEFSQLLDLCVLDPVKAEVMLKERVSDPKDIVGILSRYAKEAKRIRLDLKQEREKKLLGIRHRLETELSEVISGEAEWQFITRLAASAFPDSYSIAMLASAAQDRTTLLQLAGDSGVTINIRPQIIHAVKGIVAQEIIGDVDNSDGSRQLMALVEAHGGQQVHELRNSVQILSDPRNAPVAEISVRTKPERLSISSSQIDRPRCEPSGHCLH